MIKVRFNLGKGEKYMKWKVEDTKSGMVTYIDPEEYSIHMHGALLRNQKGTAKKIHSGANKTVCAWIECTSIEVSTPVEKVAQEVSYNPRVTPNWVIGSSNADLSHHTYLFTNSKKVYKEWTH